MRIYVLGQLTVEAGEAVAHERDLPGNQARVALAMLAVEHKRALARDQIADELWPERLPASWQTALRAVISKVRSSLSTAGIDRTLKRLAVRMFESTSSFMTLAFPWYSTAS